MPEEKEVLQQPPIKLSEEEYFHLKDELLQGEETSSGKSIADFAQGFRKCGRKYLKQSTYEGNPQEPEGIYDLPVFQVGNRYSNIIFRTGDRREGNGIMNDTLLAIVEREQMPADNLIPTPHTAYSIDIYFGSFPDNKKHPALSSDAHLTFTAQERSDNPATNVEAQVTERFKRQYKDKLDLLKTVSQSVDKSSQAEQAIIEELLFSIMLDNEQMKPTRAKVRTPAHVFPQWRGQSSSKGDIAELPTATKPASQGPVVLPAPSDATKFDTERFGGSTQLDEVGDTTSTEVDKEGPTKPDNSQ